MKRIINKLYNHNLLTVAILLAGMMISMSHHTLSLGVSAVEVSDEKKLSDENINHFIQTELIVQDGVNWNNIDVSTTEGIVTLTGTAINLLAKDRAIHIAKAIKGVRAVVDNLNVQQYNVSDQQLTNDVNNALLTDPATESYEVKVAADNGKIILSGKVDSWQEKMLSDKVARSVKGVRAVENSIHFDLKNDRSDWEIKQDIVQSLKWDIRVDDAFIDIAVKDGIVTLSGTVGSAAEESQAKINAWVAGVSNVITDDLRLADWASDEEIRKREFEATSDQDIKEAVKDAFLYDPRVMSFNPNVQVKNGIVTLTGFVDNLKAKNAAERDARNVVGVWKVDNMLKVRVDDYPSDPIVKSSVENALRLNPLVESYEIDVLVRNGSVTLLGTVDNYQEKFEAEEIASTIYGVSQVKNKLITDLTATPYAFDYNSYYYYPYGVKYNNHPVSAKSDREIKEDIENQIWWSPYVNLTDVDIEVDNGIAQLSGEVDSWSEYNYAEKNAYDGGAIFVENDLIVDYVK